MKVLTILIYNHSVLMNAIIVKTFKKAVLIELLVSSEKYFQKVIDNKDFLNQKWVLCMTLSDVNVCSNILIQNFVNISSNVCTNIWLFAKGKLFVEKGKN